MRGRRGSDQVSANFLLAKSFGVSGIAATAFGVDPFGDQRGAVLFSADPGRVGCEREPGAGELSGLPVSGVQSAAAARELRAFHLGAVWIYLHGRRGESGAGSCGRRIRSSEAQLRDWIHAPGWRLSHDLRHLCLGRQRRQPHSFQYEYGASGRVGAAAPGLIGTVRDDVGLQTSAFGLRASGFGPRNYFDGFAGLVASLAVAAGAGVESAAGGDFFGGGFLAASARLRSW